jgi:hypothetical protein
MLTYTYAIYIGASLLLTVWVAHSLSTRGRVFLVQFMRGNEALADSINHLLVVGFYLLNLGYASLALSYGTKPRTIDQAIEFLSFKLGLVLVVLGATHFFNMSMIAKLGYWLDETLRRSKLSWEAERNVTPAG